MPGIDYDITYAPAVETSTIRLMLSFAASRSLVIHQADIPTAYLNAGLDNKVFIKQPDGFESESLEKVEMVCSLNKAIYGLKQSGRSWWTLLHKFIIDVGFTKSDTDPCLYHIKYHEDTGFIAIYVDDILLASSSDEIRNNTLSLLEEKFNANVIGPATWVLSLHIVQSCSGITMDQITYIDTILERYGMASCNVAHTPMATSAPLHSDENHTLSESNQAL